ncbi:MAG: alpha/beta hydrolase [Pseudomonadota bacterium]
MLDHHGGSNSHDARSDALSAYRHRWTPPAAGETRSLLLLHGTGDDEVRFDAFGAALAEGAVDGAGRLSLRGDVSEGGAARFFRRKAEGVYDMADLAQRTAGLERFLGSAYDVYGLAPERTIGVGFSNGANMLANLVFSHPGRVRRAALLRPLIPFEPPQTDLFGVSVLLAAGRHDPIAPVAATERLAEALAARGADVTLRWSEGGHGLSAEEAPAIRAFHAAAPR